MEKQLQLKILSIMSQSELGRRFLSRLKKLIGEIENNPTSEDSMARLSAELAFIQTELK